MRLIDLDKALTEAEDECRMSDDWKVAHEMMNVFKYQPTVKAIPINWIKNWCVKNYPTYPRIITEELLKKTETWRMIEDWEKEKCD